MSPATPRQPARFDFSRFISRQAWACLALGLCLVPFTGCGCGKEEVIGIVRANDEEPDAGYAERAAEFAKQQEAKKAAKEAALAAKAEAAAEAQRERDEAKEARDAQLIPKSFAEWEIDHFRKARIEAQPQLPDAILNRAGETSDSAEYAALWIELLPKPEAPPEPESGAKQQSDDNEDAPVQAMTRAEEEALRHQMLAKMLGNRGQGQSSGHRSVNGVTDALIEALAKNTTPAAHEALMNLVRGKQPVEGSEPDAARMAFDKVVQQGETEQLQFLLSVLINPEQYRAADAEPSAATLQGWGVEFARGVQSSGFRTQLAKQLPTNPNYRQPLVNLLTETRWENIGAQIVMFLNPEMDEESKARLMRMFADYEASLFDKVYGWDDGRTPTGAPTPNQVAGVPDKNPVVMSSQDATRMQLAAILKNAGGGQNNRGGGSSGSYQSQNHPTRQKIALPDESLGEVLKLLWHPQLVERTRDDLTQVKSLSQDRLRIELGGMFPENSVRSALYGAMKPQWKEGAYALLTDGVIGSGVRDPGFLVLLKAMPRTPRNDDSQPRDLLVPQQVDPNEDNARKRNLMAQQDEYEARHQWQDALQDYTQVVFDRIREMAVPPESGVDPQEIERPYRLHRGARVVQEFHFDLDSRLQELAGSDLEQVKFSSPLSVYYTRIEENGRFIEMNKEYERQAPGSERVMLPSGIWHQGLQSDKQKNTLISKDFVILREKAPDDSASKYVIEKLTVELLWMEIPNFGYTPD